VRDTYLIHLDLDRLRTRLAGVEGAPPTVRQWLKDIGYVGTGKSDEWVGEDLTPLHEDDILSMQLNNEMHGSVD
jgi:hypothetical protein